MPLDFSGMEAAVEAQKGIVPSVKTFIQNLKDQLATELAAIPAAQAIVARVMTDLQSHNADLSTAIQANDPDPVVTP